MTNFCSSRRPLRLLTESIDDADAALRFVRSLISIPPIRETFGLLLDHNRRGLTVVHVVGDPHPDAVFEVGDYIAERAHDHDDSTGLILASIRPGALEDLADADRWIELDDQFETVGIELIEWFAIGRGTHLPRTLVGDPPRWDNS